MSYYEKTVEKSELLAIKLLQNVGINCHKNNLKHITDVDLISDSGVKIDVQYSCNFAKYGDCRIDIVSAFFPRIHFTDYSYVYDRSKSFLDNFQLKYHCEVKKPGKVLVAGYLDALIILFYDYELNLDVTPPHILIFKVDKLCESIEKNPEFYFNKIMINDKGRHSLSDTHGSAFVPIKVDQLVKETGGFFGTYNELLDNQEYIKKHLRS